jgi:5-methylcytosine-specific restriction enzyme subunit McrC
MQVIEAIERRPFSLPIKEVLDENGDLSFLQNIKDKGYFNVEFQSSKLTLVAGNHVGQIPLTNDIVINVKPKVPINNLARVISLGNQPVKCLNYFKRTYNVEGTASRSLLEAIATSLVTSLKILDAEGVYRQYVRKEERIPTLRGKVNLSKYVQQVASKRSLSSLHCTYYELSADTLYNRLIKKAVFQIAHVLDRQDLSQRSLLAELNYFANRLGNVRLIESKSVESQVKEHLLHNRIPTLRDYYLDIIDTCLIILEGSGVELINSQGVNSMHSFIVNLENAFEFYVREVLRQSAKLNNSASLILDGNNEGRSTLFSDNLKYDVKPDIVIGSKKAALAIGDVKYKAKVGETDRYQLIAHAAAYNTNLAFFVTPLMGEENNINPYVGKIDQTEIYHFQMNLDARNLIESEEALRESVENLIFQKANTVEIVSI